ncbi:uncharacterized protein LOC111702914 isoform X6 [Eurytemora carolleeae]|uniref:uncharacterized protein LOC111702914 isoform X6 n=1 Tax=Eurytemora carolleeae TaxID=1294199 RepID=UPI000C78954A|nr:uncharacterized protein LOC111702914 isoform X6 [Eurytemora carolleeae]|eukprot:XP_023330489.1 uncharacterized protein LOC111702914 isoform X6 [Eurytemora affinis]
MSTGIPCKIINNETIEKIYVTEEKTPVEGRNIECNACTDPYDDHELEYDDRELEYEYEPGISLSALHFSRENNGKWLGHCKGCRCISSAPSEHCGGCVCLQESDLQLAAELGKTLLERNRELENSIKHQQAIIDDQGQEIEYLTKQTTALREVNESRIRVYEQMEISLQEAENINSKLLEESSSDKSRIKSLSGLVEHLEQKCEELQCLIQFNKKQVEVQELQRRKQGRNGSGIDGTRRSSVVQDDCRRPEHEVTAEDGLSKLENEDIIEVEWRRLDITDAVSPELEERKLELEVIELNTEVEQLTALKKQDDSRIVELEEQILSLVVEKKRLISEAGPEGRGRGGEGRIFSEEYSVLANTHNRRNLSICLCSELLQADCVKQMSKSNIKDQPEDQECHVNVKISKQLGSAVSFKDNDNPVNENKEEVPIEKIENSSGDNHTSFEEETDEPYINATNDQDQVVHGVLTAEEKSGMLIESAETAVSKLDIKTGVGRALNTNISHLLHSFQSTRSIGWINTLLYTVSIFTCLIGLLRTIFFQLRSSFSGSEDNINL